MVNVPLKNDRDINVTYNGGIIILLDYFHLISIFIFRKLAIFCGIFSYAWFKNEMER